VPVYRWKQGCEMKHQEYKGQIDSVHCFSAVGSALPGRAAAPKGGGVHPSKSHVSWVKYGAISHGSWSKPCYSGISVRFGKTNRYHANQ